MGPYGEEDVVLEVLEELEDVAGHALELEDQIHHRVHEGRLPLLAEGLGHEGEERVGLPVDASEPALGLLQMLHPARGQERRRCRRRCRCRC